MPAFQNKSKTCVVKYGNSIAFLQQRYKFRLQFNHSIYKFQAKNNKMHTKRMHSSVR